jgi:N-acetyl-gamma-glutamyl-phosphate reductase common form
MSTPLYIYGASGLLAGELMRLVEAHPIFQLAGAITRNPTGTVCDLHPNLTHAAPLLSKEDAAPAIAAALAEGPCALVLGLPHGESAAAWLSLEAALGDAAAELMLVDLSADHRLADASVYAEVYGQDHPAPTTLSDWTYGLIEHNREAIAHSKRVAAPGCFATAMQLACVPAAAASLITNDSPWLMNAVTGSSGSGTTPTSTTHHPHRHGNFKAYARTGHRHEAEVHQACPGATVQLMPHSGPFARGIHLTASMPLAPGVTAADANTAYAKAYADQPFASFDPENAPELRAVVGSNRASLSLVVRDSWLHVTCCIDNLIKGGSGQALQALNLMAKLPETTGLPTAGLGVC